MSKAGWRFSGFMALGLLGSHSLRNSQVQALRSGFRVLGSEGFSASGSGTLGTRLKDRHHRV